jgi:hypothetical protein
VSAPDAGADTRPAERTHWGTLKLHGMYNAALGDNQVEGWNRCGIFFLDFYAAIKVNSSAGVSASFEYVVAKRFGFEASFVYWREAVNLEFEATGLTITGSPNFVLPLLGANYHFLSRGPVDLYAGPVIGLGVVATGWPYDEIQIRQDVALGLNLQADYYLSESWALGAAIKYLDFGEVQFSVFPPDISGLICDNGLAGLGHMNFVSLTLGVAYQF